MSVYMALYDLDFFRMFLLYLEQEEAHGQHDDGDIGETNQAIIVTEEVDIVIFIADWRRSARHFLVRCLGVFGLFSEK